MRSRTDSRSGKTAPAPLEKHFREIVVGSGRSQEPYIIAFHYASDNVAGSALGTLFGFFEVEIHDQDAAYIVNFLASVAKKEYFANPRRSPVESFEAALHKINVALAEIVKHGNVSWLGHLHGALGAVSQNTLNFSVTGEGEIYLAREEALRSISEGLADTESEPHPLKTFTEVSSGDLFDGDLIFALSPSVWSLFSPEDLRRSLNRLGPAGFEQFLRTALVNELPIAAVALITCSAPVELQKPEKVQATLAKPAPTLDNVWSDAPFNAAREAKQSVKAAIDAAPLPEKREEYTDEKTGHIYVQASPDEAFEPDDNRWKERWTLFQHEFGTKMRGWSTASRKASRRIGKESTLAFGAVGSRLSLLRRSLARKVRSLKRTLDENRATKRRAEEEAGRLQATEAAMRPPKIEPAPQIPAPVEPMRHEVQADMNSRMPEPLTPSSERIRRFFQREAKPEITFGAETKERLDELSKRLPNLKPALGAATQRISHTAQILTDWIRRGTLFLVTWLAGFWRTLSPKEKWSVIAVLGAIASVGVIVVIPTGAETPVVQETQPAPEERILTPVFPPADEPLAALLSNHVLILPADDSSSIALTAINGSTFAVTERAIINLKTQESTTTPETIRLATGMDDLDAIFAVSESGTLYLWSTVTKKFEKNILPLPAGAKISALGAYLTYLYVLDQESGMIYRFPRAEGGFGAPTRWLKETATLATGGDMAVFENVALTLRNKEPALYTRGVRSSVTFAGTTTLVTTDAFAFDQKTGDLLVLDRANKRIVRWSTTGTLIAQYFHESFNGAETLSVSPDGTEVLVSEKGATTAWRIR
jgi:hypothetical protein